MIRLNLGCGKRHLPRDEGWVNIDQAAAAKPDKVLDIGWARWPFMDRSVDEINASHVLEHLDGAQLLHCMGEAYRVMKPGARFKIEVPHPRSDWFIGDPTHKTPIDENVLNLFSRKLCDMNTANGSANTPLAEYLGIDFDIIEHSWGLNPKWEMRFLLNGSLNPAKEEEFRHAVESLNNVVWNLSFTLERQ